MTREEKRLFRKQRNLERVAKNIARNKNRWERNGKNSNRDCPFDVEMSNMYGTCNCGGRNYNDCAGDI